MNEKNYERRMYINVYDRPAHNATRRYSRECAPRVLHTSKLRIYVYVKSVCIHYVSSSMCSPYSHIGAWGRRYGCARAFNQPRARTIISYFILYISPHRRRSERYPRGKTRPRFEERTDRILYLHSTKRLNLAIFDFS